MEKNHETFFRKIPMKIILHLKGNKQKRGIDISKDINSTYSHTLNCLRYLKEKGLVYHKKEKKKKVMILTEKGNKVANLLYELKNIT